MLTSLLERGFKLDLYSDFEFPAVAWHLLNLYNMHIQHDNVVTKLNNLHTSSLLHMAKFELWRGLFQVLFSPYLDVCISTKEWLLKDTINDYIQPQTTIQPAL